MKTDDTAVSIRYSHLITTRPHSIRRVFISDLHLSADEPALVQAFLALLDDLTALPKLQEFYILGDWFDSWVGDDVYLSLSQEQRLHHWMTPFIKKLSQISNNGCKIFVMHGNRDFVIGQKFCNVFHATLIHEPYTIKINNHIFRLEHGDALCTDDKSYQRFRRVIRNPLVQWYLLRRSLTERQKLAENIRKKSTMDKSSKSLTIMDVKNKAVIKAVNKVNVLLHGHTHRPNCHQLDEKKIRYVLGDWRVIKPDSSYVKVNAVIGVTTIDGLIEKKVANSPHKKPDIKNAERFHLANFQH